MQYTYCSLQLSFSVPPPFSHHLPEPRDSLAYTLPAALTAVRSSLVMSRSLSTSNTFYDPFFRTYNPPLHT